MVQWANCTTNLKHREVFHKVQRPTGAGSCRRCGSTYWLAALPPCVRGVGDHAGHIGGLRCRCFGRRRSVSFLARREQTAGGKATYGNSPRRVPPGSVVQMRSPSGRSNPFEPATLRGPGREAGNPPDSAATFGIGHNVTDSRPLVHNSVGRSRRSRKWRRRPPKKAHLLSRHLVYFHPRRQYAVTLRTTVVPRKTGDVS